MYNRLFNINLNFICNNNCRICFSHSTYSHKDIKQINIEDIEYLVDKYEINENDLVHIDGGEPTLNEDLDEILTKLERTGCQINLFSNGRLFSSEAYCNKMLKNKKRLRITIPLHGSETEHDYITDVKGSFKETLDSIVYISNNYTNIQLEIKLIFNHYLLRDSDILSILECNINNKSKIGIILNGLVKTYVSTFNQDIYYSPPNLSSWINNYFDSILKTYLYVKIQDIPLCELADPIITMIQFHKRSIINYKTSCFYFDPNNKKGKKINYNILPSVKKECGNCSFISFCFFSSERYGSLVIKNKTTRISD